MYRSCCAFAAFAFLAVSSAESAELRMVTAFPEGFVLTRELARPFMDMVAEETKGGISIALTGPDAVPPLEQFEPVQSGVFDLLFTHPAYHAGATSLGLAIDAMASDPAKRRESGVIDYLDRHYQKLGMKLVAAPVNGTYGFRYFLKEPITGEPSFAGRKIRGTVSYHPMIEALGGTGVVMGGGDVYSALQTGVLDGAAWSLTGALDFKWYEVAGYMADPVFGQVGAMIFMNLDAWNALTPEEQKAVDRAAARLEATSVVRFDVLAEEEKNALIEKGMKLTQFPAAEAERLNALFSEGVWKVAAKGAPEDAAALRALGATAGLTAAAAD